MDGLAVSLREWIERWGISPSLVDSWLFIQKCAISFQRIQDLVVWGTLGEGNLFLVILTALLCATFLTLGWRLLKFVYRTLGWTLFSVGVFIVCDQIKARVFPPMCGCLPPPP